MRTTRYFTANHPEFWAIDMPRAILSRAQTRHGDQTYWNHIPEHILMDNRLIDPYRAYLTTLCDQVKQPWLPSGIVINNRTTVKQLLDIEHKLVVARLQQLHHTPIHHPVYQSDAKHIKQLAHAAMTETPESDIACQYVQHLRIAALSTQVTVWDRGNVRAPVQQDTVDEIDSYSAVRDAVCNVRKVRERLYLASPLPWTDPARVGSQAVQGSDRSEVSEKQCNWTGSGVGLAVGGSAFGLFNTMASSASGAWFGSMYMGVLVGCVAACAAFSMVERGVPHLITQSRHNEWTKQTLSLLQEESARVAGSWQDVFSIDRKEHDWLCQMTLRLSYPRPAQDPICMGEPDLAQYAETVVDDSQYRNAEQVATIHTGVDPQQFYVLTRMCTRYLIVQSLAHHLRQTATRRQVANTISSLFIEPVVATPHS